MQAIEVVELAAEEAEAVKPVEVVLPIELQERRRFTRPIPVAQVTECDENESWELWSQWSSL